VSFDEYLDRGCNAANQNFVAQRELIRRDLPHVFPSHPRFVRSGAPSRTTSWDLARRSGVSSSSGSSQDGDAAAAAAVGGVRGGGARAGFGWACGADGKLPMSDDESGNSTTSSKGEREGFEYCLLDAAERVLVAAMVGQLYTLNPVETHSLIAPGC
jgi:hypothetical protein